MQPKVSSDIYKDERFTAEEMPCWSAEVRKKDLESTVNEFEFAEHIAVTKRANIQRSVHTSMDKRKCQVWCGRLRHLWHRPSWAVLLATFWAEYEWTGESPREYKTSYGERLKHFSMVAFQRWIQWRFLHWFKERLFHISQRHRGKTEFFCYLVEKKIAFMRTSVCLPPPPAEGQSQQALRARVKPCEPLLLPLPQRWGSKGKPKPKQGCGHGLQGRGFPSADLFCCFQQFAALGICLFYPHPTRALVSAYLYKKQHS